MAYPTTLDDAASLLVAADEKVTYLTVAALVGDTTFTVNSTTGFPTAGVLELPTGELVSYTGVGATTFTGLTRGYSGTVAQPYPLNTTIKLPLSATYVNNPRVSVIELEKKVGIGASNAASSAATGDVLKKNGDGTTSWQPETGLGYTAEDVANKATDFSVINDVKYPTTKAVDDRFDALIGAAPAALDTLSELSDALADDANFAASMTTALAGKQPLDSDLTAIAALSPSNDDVLQRKSGAWTNRTIAQLKTDLQDAWALWTPTWTNLSLGDGVVVAKYVQVGQTIICRLAIVLGSTTTVSGLIQFSFPVTSLAYGGTLGTPLGVARLFDTSLGVVYPGHILKMSTTLGGVVFGAVSGANVVEAVTSGTAPFTWATGDEILAEFFYEAA